MGSHIVHRQKQKPLRFTGQRLGISISTTGYKRLTIWKTAKGNFVIQYIDKSVIDEEGENEFIAVEYGKNLHELTENIHSQNVSWHLINECATQSGLPLFEDIE